MASSQYHFSTRWRVVGTVEEVSEILEKPEDLARWWPSVYRKAEVVAPGDERGIGRVVRVLTKGFLPYTLSWQFRVVESRRPHGFTIEAEGDFVGRGVWVLEQAGAWVEITYDWRVAVEKPGVKELSPLLRPVFAANHRWAMRKGEQSLRLELTRRRAGPHGSLPEAPPGPTTTSAWPFFIGAVAAALGVIALAGWLVSSRRRRRRRGRSCRRPCR